VQPPIFITYSSKDEKVARTICTALESRGLACWISSRNVKPGQNFQEQIVRAIRAAKIMILVFTANANNSDEIKKELALASQNNLVVIPVRIQDVVPNEAFAYEFATRQWIDLFDDWENSMARLAEQIAGTIHEHAPEGGAAPATAVATARPSQAGKRPAWVLPLVIAAACVAVVGTGTIAYLKVGRSQAPQTSSAPSAPTAPNLAPAPNTQQAATPAPVPPSPPVQAIPAEPEKQQSTALARAPNTQQAATPAPVPALPPVQAIPAEPEKGQSTALVAETIPFLSSRSRNTIRTEYMSAPDHKALAISTGPYGMVTGQADDESAKNAALASCRQRAEALAQPPRCDLYAVGNTIVYANGRPPMPPAPWFSRDRSIEMPVVIGDIPLVPESTKATLEKFYVPGRTSKALAISSSGSYAYNTRQDNIDEAVRRALEACGFHAGLPCRVIAIDDNFVVPIPTTMKAVGFFQPATDSAIAAGLRDDVAGRIGSGADGWSAVAAGTKGRAGLMLRAANEAKAIAGALADCAKQDRACRVIAIGLFAVEPK
jgi:TIR domain